MQSAIKINQLTGLRFIAALLVFFSHVRWTEISPHAARIFEAGYVGVSFFFVLSGFVLSVSYRDKILNGQLGFRKYALLRLARLMPLHLATAAPFAALLIMKGKINLLAAALNLMLLQSWVPNSAYYFSLNAPSWSLSNEIFFYLCFFFLVALAPGALLRLLLAMLAVVMGLAILLEATMPGQIVFGTNSLQHWLFYIFPAFRLIEFLIGMLLHDLWRRGYRLPSGAVVPSYFLLLATMYVARDVPEGLRMSLLFLPSIALFLFSHLTDGGKVAGFLATTPMVLLGNASFAFYLIHQPILMVAEPRLAAIGLPPLLVPLLLMGLVAAASVAVYLLFERRAEAFLKSLINARFAAPPLPQPTSGTP